MLLKPIAAFIILVSVLTSCSDASAPQSDSSINRIVYGLTLQPSGLDPHINASSELGIPLRQVYDTLIYRDPRTKEFTQGLATTWAISEDGLSYTFTLRQDVKFHDGTPFNAQAVGANLDRITNPNTGSQKAVFMLGSYSGYEIVDDYTIRLLLSEPFSPLLDSLSQVYLGIASPKAINEYSLDRYQFHQIGTGPYRFVEYIPGERIVLQHNLDYRWGPSFYQLENENTVDEIEFRFFTDAPTRVLAVANQEVQIMGEIPSVDARALTGNSAVQIVQSSIAGQPLQFLMNTKRFPTDNKAVRQSLLFATNRNEIIDSIFQRFSPVAWGPISANTLFYSRDMNGLYAQDTIQAQTLLANAGYQDSNNDGVLDIGGVDLEVTIIVPPWGLVPEVAQLLQSQWRAIGVKVNLEPVPTLTGLREKVAQNEYNLVAYYTFGLDPSFLNSFFMSNGGNNWTGYASTQLDELLTQAIRQNDSSIRRALYAQIQNIIMDEALILPIRDYVNLNAATADISGLGFDAYGWFPLLNNVTLLPE